jgi:3-hydroxyisobutyrate dehydrogenase-like beta-hydroxyacid dehydrogenase
MTKIAWIGLGVMGYPMAGHLAKAGHDVTVYNRSTAKAAAWAKEFGGKSAATPATAATGAEVVFSCVGADNDLRGVTVGQDGAFGAMSSGTYYVDCTTTSADVARELAKTLQERDVIFLMHPYRAGNPEPRTANSRSWWAGINRPPIMSPPPLTLSPARSHG